MAEEEEKLLEERLKEKTDVKLDPDFKFDKLDELLTKTQLFSEFLLEKMDDMGKVNVSLTFTSCCVFSHVLDPRLITGSYISRTLQ